MCSSAGQALYFQPMAQVADLGVSVRPENFIDLKLERSLTLARDIEVVVKSWNSRQNNAFVQRARASCRRWFRAIQWSVSKLRLRAAQSDAKRRAETSTAEACRTDPA